MTRNETTAAPDTPMRRATGYRVRLDLLFVVPDNVRGAAAAAEARAFDFVAGIPTGSVAVGETNVGLQSANVEIAAYDKAVEALAAEAKAEADVET